MPTRKRLRDRLNPRSWLPSRTPSPQPPSAAGPSGSTNAAQQPALFSGSNHAANLPNSHGRSSSKPIARSTAQEGVKTTLRVLKESADAFGPLKSAAGGLIAVIDLLETTSQNAVESKRLMSQLSAVANVLRQQCVAPVNTETGMRIKRLSDSIQEQLDVVETLTKQNRASRVANAHRDKVDLGAVLQRISEAQIMFLVETGLSIEKITQSIEKTGQKTGINVKLERLNSELHPVRKATNMEESPVPRRACTKGTRSDILFQLTRWAMDPNDKKVYCLNGMAGTGKTTIGCTLIQILEAASRLGGIFFCSRADEDCGDARKIVPTIAYQLARRFPAVREALVPLLSDSIIERSFQNLIVKPLEKATESAGIQHPIVVVIDALDECSSRPDVQKLLNDILSVPSTLPIKFFVTFRPEHEFLSLLRRPNDVLHRFHLHEVERSFVENDIRLYLRERLDTIAEERRQCGVDLDCSWPPSGQLEELVAQSGRLFIYAATVCEYIGNRGGGSLVDRLRSILDVGRDKTEKQTEQIDVLYRGILSKAFDGLEEDEAVRVADVLRVVVTAQTPLKIDVIAKLLGIDSRNGIAESMLSLHSVIHIPLQNGPVTTFHASFPDFLTSERRAGVRYLVSAESHLFLANRCFQMMTSLHENMCNVEGRPTNSVIQQNIVDETVHDALAYACQHWVHHCCSSGTFANCRELYHLLADFFLQRNLPWIECLSLRGNLYDAVRMLHILESWVSTVETDILISVRDTRRFISQNIELLIDNAMETYFSALVWLPRKSRIRRRFFLGRGLPEICGGLDNDWDSCEMILGGHSDSVNCVAFSLDGSRVVTSSNDCTARVWNASTGEQEHELAGHSKRVNCVAFSPDGGRIVTGSGDSTARVWNASTGEQAHELAGHSNSVYCVAFSLDGGRIVTGSEDSTARVWNTLTGDEEHALAGHSAALKGVAYSLDGSRIVTGSHDHTARVWNTSTGEQEHKLFGHSADIECVAFSPDGGMIVTGSYESTARVWNTSTGEQEHKLAGHSHSVNCVAFSPGGGRIVTGSHDKTARVWITSTGEEEHELAGHSSIVNCVAFSPDGGRIVTGSLDNTARVWITSTGEQEHELAGHSSSVYCVVFSPDGGRIVTGSYDSTARVWNMTMGEQEHESAGHSHSVNCVALSPDGGRVVTGSDDSTARVWNTSRGEQEHELAGHLYAVNCVAFSPDGGRIVTVSNDNTARVWNTSTGGQKHELAGHSYAINCIAFSPDGGRIVTGSDDSTARVWNTSRGEQEHELAGHSDSVNCVAFSPDGSRVVTGSLDSTARVWNTSTGEQEHELPGHSDWVYCVAFSPDGGRIVTGSDDSTARVWNASTGEQEHELVGHLYAVNCVAFSPDGGRIVTGSLTDEIRVYTLGAQHFDILQDDNHCILGHGSFICRTGPRGNFVIQSPETQALSLSYDNQWLLLLNCNVRFWLPPAYRNFRSCDIRGSSIVLGYSSGRVLWLTFPSQ